MTMENQDTLFEQIKRAESNAESTEFAGLDSVWSRVEDKLDNKVLVKQNRKWKQWAAAASIVAVFSIGYQFFKSDGQHQESTSLKMVATDTVQPVFESENAVSNAVADTAVIRKDAPKLLRDIISASSISDAEEDVNLVPGAANAQDDITDDITMPAPAAEAIAAEPVEERGVLNSRADIRDRSLFPKGHVFKARSVKSEERGFFEEPNKEQTASAAKKATPLFVVDGKPIVAKNEAEYEKKLKRATSEIDAEEYDTLIYLKEPLYIINGVEYSEESLFGPQPTSPYAPLNLQQEGMTTLIITGEDAVKKYGKKGKNGVVIITTKNGKPAPKK